MRELLESPRRRWVRLRHRAQGLLGPNPSLRSLKAGNARTARQSFRRPDLQGSVLIIAYIKVGESSTPAEPSAAPTVGDPAAGNDGVQAERDPGATVGGSGFRAWGDAICGFLGKDYERSYRAVQGSRLRKGNWKYPATAK